MFKNKCIAALAINYFTHHNLFYRHVNSWSQHSNRANHGQTAFLLLILETTEVKNSKCEKSEKPSDF